ncbi:MAG TPA: sialidase family protein, partial [Bacteroidota bacterium]|nr:sialidase family protein [Bacteroidota bacterium]
MPRMLRMLRALLVPTLARILTLGFTGTVPAPSPEALAAGENFRIHPGPVTQTEPVIVRHPLNDSILFVAANTIDLSSGFISEGIYMSPDGGPTWSGSDTCNGAPIQFHRGDPGVAIDRNGVFILTRLGFSPGLYSHFSTDAGVTWSAQKQIASNDQDRADLATDGDPSSPYFGTTYAAWVRFSPPYPVLVSATTDGGSTWSVPVQVNNPTQRCQGADIEVGPGGAVSICWAGVISTSPFTEDFVGFARSTDGGAVWTVTENAFDINGIAGTFPQKANIRVNGLPRLAIDNSGWTTGGRIYIVTTEKNLLPAGSDPDIILRFSSDSGATWSAGIRVNRDMPNNGKIQYFPALHTDDWGGVDILYYSDEPTTSDSAAIFLALSIDGGISWEAGEIGDHRFLPQPIGGLGAGYQGDNITLTSSGDMLWPVWTDNSSGIYQIWTSP